MPAMTLAPAGSAALAQRLKPLLDPLFAFAHARCSRRELALDAVQETLRAALAAAREGRQWPDDEALWAWLVAVARNKLADEFRALSRGGLRSGSVAADELAPALLDGAPWPPEWAGRAEVARLCNAALSELPPRQRQVLEARYRHGLGHDAIGQELGISAKAAESLLARARQALEQVLRRMVARPEELL